jgi:hypothetical protein
MSEETRWLVNVSATATVTQSVMVEADTEAEAIDKAIAEVRQDGVPVESGDWDFEVGESPEPQ